MDNNIKTIISFANMLSKTFGKFMQITISDTQKRIFVDNVIENEAFVGGALSDNERFFLENTEIKKLPFIANYKSVSTKMTKLRSSTFFFKDKKGNIEYLFTITTNVDDFMYLRGVFDIFINGCQSSASVEEEIETAAIDNVPKLNLSINEIVDTVVNEGEKRYGAIVKRMTRKEKESIIREIHSRGIFLIKGAVTETAEKLNYSEATIYRYLQKLEGE